MSTLMNIIEDERDRLERLEKYYLTELSKFPKGYLSDKRINGNVYSYRAFREGGTVRTVYLGSVDSEEVQELKNQIAERRKIQDLLKRARENLKEAKRVLRAKR
ncbi:MAG: hypothetical protein A2015_11305 [Spirochaetes bacterium GWF1_31_7]|nr:MAG: hypothetical protein A2Y30_02540 [Spirochaetes bacterium GWE1_32_154]OHD46828.1 MAG: hypothetical protein A2Y29_09845 [Spirochaetes bacterium GWE2_31_10]OHD47785.1 MAG: hypothetical protein A2015_11305 [Spirochaetes bacterium GWF1_31_7]OHD75334.1 MAG: hypothetical protein A2355_03410 [Spirochaetes bacterium RIFOXYB1_FULL_32_8]HBD95640.1 hypothetical protein [Spirochaetia bacterium]